MYTQLLNAVFTPLLWKVLSQIVLAQFQMMKLLMKKMKMMNKIGLFAVVIGLLFSCAKGDKYEPEPETYERTVQVTFTKDVNTKTAVVEGETTASYVWTDGDHQYFKVWENETLGTGISASYSPDMKIATLSVNFNTVSASEYVYKAYFAKGISNSNNLQIQNTQSPTATSYDPGADVMYADNLTSSTAATTLKFILHRAITVNKLTLKGMTPGEKVSNVELTFNKNVTGYFDPSNGNYSLDGKKLTLSYSNLAVGEDGTFPVYFTCAPVDGISLQSIVISTDANTYNRTTFSKTYNFQIGKMVRFGGNMEGYATPITTTITYTLVESQTDLEDGTYIIAAADFDVAMGALDSGNYHTRVTGVTKSSDGKRIVLDDASTVIPIEITKSGDKYVLKNTVSGNYLAYTGNKNTSTEQASAFNWTITINNDNTATIDPAGNGARSFRYNNNSGQERFACYANTLNAVALYKRGNIGISFEQEAIELIKGTEDYLSFVGQTVTRVSGDTRTVTYAMSGDGIGSITSTGAVTLNGTTGTATVTATVGSDATYSAGSVSYTITVSPQATEYDLLDYAFIGVTHVTEGYPIYTAKTGLIGSSARGSIYSSLTAGGTATSGETIQMRTSNSNSGIVTTASGGYVTKIVLTWNSATVNGRAVEIYGKNTAYSAPSDLYDSNTQGTLIGELAKGSTTLTITGNYKYIGIRSKADAVYLNEIRVYWQDASGTDPIINVTAGNPTYVAKEGGSQSISYSITNPVSGQSLSATSNASWISNVSVGSSTITFNVAAQSSGAVARSGMITLSYNGASNVQVSVIQEAGEGGSQAANGWLELPAKQTGSDYYNGVFKVGSARNYSYMYQYSTYTSMWTAYPLYASTMSGSEAIPGPYTPMQMASEEDRGQTWAANPNIEKSLQVNVWSGSYNVNLVNPPYVSDYYARGHQIPNADRSNNGNMQTQTYYATNSTPQIQNRFNGYIWGNLEDAVRESVKDTVYVATGPVFRTVGGSESITIIHPSHDTGKDVPVPNYYWKVLLKVKRTNGVVTSASAVGFWFEHKQYNSQDYTPYVKSVNQIEALTGLDFFVNLPDNLEETAEANTNWTTFKNF